MRTVLLSVCALGVTQRLRMAADVANGMRHLHSLDSIHRDLKSDNCLVGEHMRVKVADFGASRLLQSGRVGGAGVGGTADGASSALTGAVGTPLWMAPELLGQRADYGQEIDIYSYGIVMWELLTRQTPWEHLEASEARFMLTLRDAIVAGDRPRLPQHTVFPHAYMQVMTKCWSGQPHARPSFVDIAKALEALLSFEDE